MDKFFFHIVREDGLKIPKRSFSTKEEAENYLQRFYGVCNGEFNTLYKFRNTWRVKIPSTLSLSIYPHWNNIGEFPSHEEALQFSQQRLGADKNGCLHLLEMLAEEGV